MKVVLFVCNRIFILIILILNNHFNKLKFILLFKCDACSNLKELVFILKSKGNNWINFKEYKTRKNLY